MLWCTAYSTHLLHALQDRGWKVVNVSYLEWEMLPEDPHTKAAALLQVIAQELGPKSNWQQVGPPAASEAAAAAAADLSSNSTAGLADWRSRTSLDGGVAAAAAAAVAAAVGGEAFSGVVNRRGSTFGQYDDLSGLYNTQQATRFCGSSELGAYSLLGNAGLFGAGGVAVGVPATPLGVPVGSSYGDWQSMNANGLWGRSDAASFSNPWAADGALQQLQQQRALEAFISADASAAAAAPRQMSPEHLAVGGPTSASSRNGSCSSQHADSPDSKGAGANRVARSLQASPEAGCSSKSSTSGDDEGSSRMAPFIWGDGLGIWKPLATAGQL